LVGGLGRGRQAVRSFTAGVKKELADLKGVFSSVEGKLAGLGISFGIATALTKSAQLDKTLKQTGNTAGFTGKEIAGLRKELFEQSKLTGATVEELKSGYDAYIAAGQSARAAKEEIAGTNIAMAVTGANAQTLAGGLTVAGQAFQFDLEKPGLALELLDKMTVAGRKGNAELENLADIFGRVGVNASSAGLGFEKTLGFIEVLSLVERQPERLATLADSTLRLFNNLKYAEKATEATGVRFFDKKGQRKDPLEVLKEFRTEYRKLKTDQSRSKFIQGAFGEVDSDTLKGLRTLFQGGALDKIGEFERDIRSGVGTLNRELPDAISNAVDQAGRLKATLREAADEFAQPINAAIANSIKRLLAPKDKGGWGLSGKEIGGYAAGGVVTAYALSRILPPAIGKLFGSTANLATGITAGKALEQAVGVTPVFVTNWPDRGLLSGPAEKIPEAIKGAGAAGASATGAAATRAASFARIGLPAAALGGGFAVGYGFNRALQGTAFMDAIDRGVAGFFAPRNNRGSRVSNSGAGIDATLIKRIVDEASEGFFARRANRGSQLHGNEDARAAIEASERTRQAGEYFSDLIKKTPLGGDLRITIDMQSGTARVSRMAPDSSALRWSIDTGPTMVLPQ
jgi:TP901 family phage tail tape measure protein